MKTIEIPTMTKDEIDMLDGLSGQMSDGAGENCSWCHNYWPHMNGFENKDGKSYFTFQEMGAFKDKADDEIIKDIGKRFNQICKFLIAVLNSSMTTNVAISHNIRSHVQLSRSLLERIAIIHRLWKTSVWLVSISTVIHLSNKEKKQCLQQF